MLKLKRRPIDEHTLEPWLEYSRRSFRAAATAIRQSELCVLSKLDDLKRSWAGHIARFGLGPREFHPLKSIISWRPWSWWTDQELYNSLNWCPIRHAPRIGRPKRWEQQFSSNWVHVLATLDN